MMSIYKPKINVTTQFVFKILGLKESYILIGQEHLE